MNQIIITPAVIEKFLTARKKAATQISIGVTLCILSPTLLLTLLSLSHQSIIDLPEAVVSAIGVSFILLLVAISVGLFLSAHFKINSYEMWEYNEFEISDELTEKLQEEKEDFSSNYSTMMIVGVMLCILSSLPLISGVFFRSSNEIDDIMVGLTAITLIIISIGVFFIVRVNIIMDSYKILLQTDDYTSENKRGRKIMEKYAAIYWLAAALIYLSYSFISKDWGNSWFVWPIAGIIYAILENTLSLKNKKTPPSEE